MISKEKFEYSKKILYSYLVKKEETFLFINYLIYRVELLQMLLDIRIGYLKLLHLMKTLEWHKK